MPFKLSSYRKLSVRNLLLWSLSSTMVVSGWSTKWIDLKASSQVQPARSGHVAFKVQEKVYVFGGYAEESPEKRYPLNDVWCFDKGEWACVQPPSAEMPQARLAAAAVTCAEEGAEIGVVIGGWDSQQAGTGGVILNDVQAFSGESNAWTPLLPLDNDQLQQTSRSCAIALPDNRILLHNHRCLDHVLIFHVAERKWEKQAVTGTPPSSRGLHACAMLPGTAKIVLFGGAAQSGLMSNELFVLDTTTWEWTKPTSCPDASQHEDALPCPRASPCFVALNDTTCLLYGGASVKQEGGLHGNNDLWLLELHDNDSSSSHIEATWTQLHKDGDANSPPGRNAATLTQLSSCPFPLLKGDHDKQEGAQYFLLTGGWYPFRTTYSDNFVLKVTQPSSSS